MTETVRKLSEKCQLGVKIFHRFTNIISNLHSYNEAQKMPTNHRTGINTASVKFRTYVLEQILIYARVLTVAFPDLE